MTVAVLGAGSWGCALTTVFSKIDNVVLLSKDAGQISFIQQHKTDPKYLPAEVNFADNIIFTANLREVLETDLLIFAVPVNAVRGLLTNLLEIVTATHAKVKLPDIILTCKGFELDTGCLPHQIVAEVLHKYRHTVNVGALLGPSFAHEVALDRPTLVTLASANTEFAFKWINKFASVPNFRVYASDDIIGSEVCAAVKNVLAIAVGIADGLAMGYNARAALITRGMVELRRLVLALGGSERSIYGLTGVGDLILTCTGDLSRNRQVGISLAKGDSIDHIISTLGYVAEGVLTAKVAYELSLKLSLSMPLAQSVYKIIYEQCKIDDVILGLLNRDPKSEFN